MSVGEDALRRAQLEQRRRAIHEREEREFDRARSADEVEQQRRKAEEMRRKFQAEEEKGLGHLYRFAKTKEAAPRRADSADYFARLDRERKAREAAESEERRKQARVDAEHAAAMARLEAEAAATRAREERTRKRESHQGPARPWTRNAP